MQAKDILLNFGEVIYNESKCVRFRLSSTRANIDGKQRNIFRYLWEAYGNSCKSSDKKEPLCETENCLVQNHFTYIDVFSKEYIYQRILQKSVTQPNGCILSTIKPHTSGYITFGAFGSKYKIHRLIMFCKSDEYTTMDDLPDLGVRHLCGEPKCVNHLHLKFGTAEEQHQDKVVHGSAKFGETHPWSTITEDTAKKIIASWREKNHVEFKTIVERSKMFGVSAKLVQCIDDRRAWKYLPHPNGKPDRPKKKSKIKSFTDSSFDYEGARLRLKAKSTINENDCWVWSSICKDPYPTIGFAGCSFKAHVLAAQVQERKIAPRGLCALHKCNIKRCVNPEHLYFGTNKDNARDSLNAGTSKSYKLTVDQIQEIKQSNSSLNDLAAIHKVTPKQISRIRNGKVWKNLLPNHRDSINK